MRQKILRKGAKVKRWHTLTNVKEQTVADHSWGVVSIILDVWPNSSIALITFALWHDVPEFAIGDIPVTAKWENKNLAKELEKIENKVFVDHNLYQELTQEEQLKLAIADILEALWYATEEIALGNTHFQSVFKSADNKLEELLETFKEKTFIGVASIREMQKHLRSLV